MSVYGMSFRLKVISLIEQGWSNRQISLHLKIDPHTVAEYRRKHQEGDLSAAKTGPKQNRKLTPTHLEKIRKLIADKPDITLSQVSQEIGLDVQDSTISRALKKMGITRKKKRFEQPSKGGQTSQGDVKTS
jgi:transposase